MDLRVDPDWIDNVKSRRLARALGQLALLSLLLLWCWARKFRPKGNLDGLTHAEIAEAARWEGKGGPDRFVEALIEYGLLDRDAGGALSIHDWSEHQPYASTEQDRKKQASDAAKSRWNKTSGMRPADAANDAPHSGQQKPLSSPVPTVPDHPSPSVPAAAAAARENSALKGKGFPKIEKAFEAYMGRSIKDHELTSLFTVEPHPDRIAEAWEALVDAKGRGETITNPIAAARHMLANTPVDAPFYWGKPDPDAKFSPPTYVSG